MRDLIGIDDLTDSEIRSLADASLRPVTPAPCLDPRLPPVGLIFGEASTRTRVSFERAAHQLGRTTILIEAKGSSLEKGESLADTLGVLRADGIRHFVVRTSQNEALREVSDTTQMSLVNGGDGTNEHPTQVLADLVCLLRAAGGDWNRLQGFKLGVFGDLTRSRVARSWSKLAPRVGIQLSFLSPKSWRPDWLGKLPWTDDKQAWAAPLDAVMALRVQKERMLSADSQEMAEFARRYQLGLQDLGAKQWLLHPGPVNWGVELGAELRTDKRSLIHAQMEAGLALRTRVLELCL